MGQQVRRLRREELYERVWTTPIRKLAPEFGLSDVGLAKICIKHQIPRPGLGYWRRVEMGQSPPRTPLPGLSETHLEVIEILFREKEANWKSRVAELRLLEASQAAITVLPDQPISHALAIRTQKLLAHPQKSESGRAYPNSGAASHVNVTEKPLPRAIRILDALLHAFDSRGYTLKWPKGEASKLSVIVLDEELLFSISEVVKAKPHMPTAPELARQKRALWVSMPRWDYEPTGRLEAKVESTYWSGGQHRRSDSKTHRLEDCLSDFVLAVKFVAEQTKRRKEEHERQRREWAEREKRAQEERVQQAEAARRVEFITKLAHSWQESRLLRDFMKSLTQASQKLELAEEQQRDFQCMVAWVTSYADSVDPIRWLLPWILERFASDSPGG